MTRMWNQQQLGYVEHTSVSGEAWQFIFRGTTSGAGAAGGTTVVDASADSGGADTYNGRYWVHILSGDNEGEWKRVIDDDGSGTLAVENNGFTNQVAASVRYELWKSPEPVVVVDSTTATTIVDAVRAEANDFWNGYYLIPINGTDRGLNPVEITDFVSATGTFTVANNALDGVSAGDVLVLRRFVEVGGISLPGGHAYHPRPQNRVNFAVGDGTIGAKSGEVSFNTHVFGSGSLAAADAAANKSELHGLLVASGLELSQGTSATVGAGSTTTAIKIATGKWENLTIGQLVEYQGNVRRITAQTDGAGAEDTITVSPALPYAPTSGDVLHAMCNYQKSTDGDGMYGVTLEYEVDGVRYTITGCKGNVQLVDGPVLEFSFSFTCNHWIREIEAAPYNAGTAYTSQPSILNSDRKAWLDTTGTDIKGFTAQPGSTFAMKQVQGSTGINGGSELQHTGYACGCTFREILSSSGDLDQDLRWTARTSRAILVVYGGHGNAMAVSIPAGRLIESPNPEDGDGMVEVPNVVEAQDAGNTTDPDATIVKIPDFSICLS